MQLDDILSKHKERTAENEAIAAQKAEAVARENEEKTRFKKAQDNLLQAVLDDTVKPVFIEGSDLLAKEGFLCSIAETRVENPNSGLYKVEICVTFSMGKKELPEYALTFTGDLTSHSVSVSSNTHGKDFAKSGLVGLQGVAPAIITKARVEEAFRQFVSACLA